MEARVVLLIRCGIPLVGSDLREDQITSRRRDQRS